MSGGGIRDATALRPLAFSVWRCEGKVEGRRGGEKGGGREGRRGRGRKGRRGGRRGGEHVSLLRDCHCRFTLLVYCRGKLHYALAAVGLDKASVGRCGRLLVWAGVAGCSCGQVWQAAQ